MVMLVSNSQIYSSPFDSCASYSDEEREFNAGSVSDRLATMAEQKDDTGNHLTEAVRTAMHERIAGRTDTASEPQSEAQPQVEPEKKFDAPVRCPRSSMATATCIGTIDELKASQPVEPKVSLIRQIIQTMQAAMEQISEAFQKLGVLFSQIADDAHFTKEDKEMVDSFLKKYDGLGTDTSGEDSSRFIEEMRQDREARLLDSEPITIKTSEDPESKKSGLMNVYWA